MRFFKHGDSLAIVLPEPLRKSSGVKENDEYEFFEIEPGEFIVISRAKLADNAKKTVVAELALRALKPETRADVASAVDLVSVQPAKAKAYANPVLAQLDSKGFVILDKEDDAKMLSKQLEREIKDGKVRGVRGFDKKFYVVSSTALQKFSEKLLPALSGKEPLSASNAAQVAGLDEQACLAALQVLREDGEVLEKKRGHFIAVK